MGLCYLLASSAKSLVADVKPGLGECRTGENLENVAILPLLKG